ncbi:MAG: O-methyltransferase [Pseudonocardia sp.]|nr:O-methyltransferase [Pseudonocardia sp.]
MSAPQNLWTEVDEYMAGLLVGPDEVLDAALRDNAAAGLPPIDVSPVQGKFLHLLVRVAGARRVLEIGTLGGYSTIWLARGLPEGGRVVTLEYSPAHAAVARANLARAGLSDVVEVREGAALDLLPGLVDEEPFDLVFVDADKESNTEYLDWAVRLARPGATVVVDNVVRQGRIVDARDPEPRVRETRRFFDALAADGRVDATALQTVGAKGHDGFLLAVVR